MKPQTIQLSHGQHQPSDAVSTAENSDDEIESPETTPQESSTINKPDIDIDHDTTTTKSSTKQEQCYQTLYFMVRYFIVLLTLVLSLIASIYAVSALIETEATDFFCPKKDSQQVHDRNRKEGLNGGSSFDCWFIDRPSVDLSKIKQLQLDIYQAHINYYDQSFVTIFGCMIFSFLALFLLFIALQNGYYTIYDTLYTFVFTNEPNPRIVAVIVQYSDGIKAKRYSITAKMSELKNGDKSCCKRCVLWSEYLYDQYCYIYEKYLYFDSKWKILNSLVWEVMEIIVQFYGLCLYGGLNLFNMDDVILGQEYHVVEAFCIIIGLNCVLCGLCWLVYVVWHDMWYATIFS